MPKGNPARLAYIREQQKKEPQSAKVFIGANCNIDKTAVIGRDGFGYEPDEEGNLIFFPHFGHVVIGDNVDIGAYTCIDRGTLNNTFIDNGTKIDNLVHIGHNCQIGKNVCIPPGVVVGGSVIIGDNTFIGMNTCIREHVKIGSNVTIGMGSVITKDIPDSETWFGNPGRRVK